MLITAAEVSVQTGTVYTGAELDKVNSFITNVSDAIEAYCRKTFPDPAPGVIKAVALIEVRRLLNSEPGVSNEKIADLSSGYAYGGAAVILSNSSLDLLTNYLRWISPRYGSIRLVSPVRVSAVPLPTFTAPLYVEGPADLTISGRTQSEGLVQVQYSLDAFDWQDLAIAESLDRSDGSFPAWRASLMAPAASNTYRWRARFKVDADPSKWTLALTTVYEVP
ncbi:hypothetical protein [Spirillospora sp. NPDC047279]|uniref:hypothetical protein n=1 Tax=Spirillospora sp. NPDC047279 TaxID=3155478 RepID=UPI0034051643